MEIKPLLVYWATREYLKLRKSKEEQINLVLVGGPSYLQDMISECDTEVRFSQYSSFSDRFCPWFKVVKDCISVVPIAVTMLFRHVIIPKPKTEQLDIAIFCEAIEGSPRKGIDYFYGSIYDMLCSDDQKIASYCTTPRPSSSVEDEKESKRVNKLFWLLDYLSIGDFFKSLISLLHLAFRFTFTYFKISQRAEKAETETLLRVIRSETKFDLWFIHICVYFAANRLMRECKAPRAVIQYEEKPTERAVALASKEHRVEITGYVVHPMDKALVALRDHDNDNKPRPHKYAVCGSAVGTVLNTWAKKPAEDITVWGSGKSGRPEPRNTLDTRSTFSCLLLLSHPDELRIFGTWLRSEGRLREGLTYRIRRYWPSGADHFNEPLMELKKEFNFVYETEVDLPDAFKDSNIAIYSATSTGLLAGRFGALSVHVDLNDLYRISPCVDISGPPLNCATASKFANTIDFLRQLDSERLDLIYSRQIKYEAEIFSIPQRAIIKKYLYEEKDRITVN